MLSLSQLDLFHASLQVSASLPSRRAVKAGTQEGRKVRYKTKNSIMVLINARVGIYLIFLYENLFFTISM